MLKRIIQVIAPTKKNTTSQISRNEDILIEEDINSPEQETDGFILIGSTFSERTSYKPSESECVLDTPPPYSSLIFVDHPTPAKGIMGNSESKPSPSRGKDDSDCEMITDAGNNTNTNHNSATNIMVLPPPLLSAASTEQRPQSASCSGPNLNSHTVYQDIPFTLSPKIKGCSVVSAGSTETELLTALTTNYSQKDLMRKYNYEFTLEESVIKNAQKSTT